MAEVGAGAERFAAGWAARMADVAPPPPLAYRPPAAAPRLVWEDPWILVFDKPSGLLTTPGKPADQKDCLEARARARFPWAAIVHRLDRATSGLVILARHRTAHRALHAQFEGRTVSKRYVAVAAGEPGAASGEIDAPLMTDWPRRPLQKVAAEAEGGKPSRTLWERLEAAPGYGLAATRLALSPVTGRTHQLRAHLTWIGCPILGDDFYAPPKARAAAPRLLLHAEQLAFRHPEDGREMRFEAPAPF